MATDQKVGGSNPLMHGKKRVVPDGTALFLAAVRLRTGFEVSPAGSVGSQACRPPDDARPLAHGLQSGVSVSASLRSVQNRRPPDVVVSPAGSVGS